MGGFDDWFHRLSSRASLSGYVAIDCTQRLRQHVPRGSYAPVLEGLFISHRFQRLSRPVTRIVFVSNMIRLFTRHRRGSG